MYMIFTRFCLYDIYTFPLTIIALKLLLSPIVLPHKTLSFYTLAQIQHDICNSILYVINYVRHSDFDSFGCPPLMFSSQLPDRLAILTSKGVFVLFYNF